MGCHEGVEEMVELATPASVLECGKQPRLVLDQRMINVNLRILKNVVEIGVLLIVLH